MTNRWPYNFDLSWTLWVNAGFILWSSLSTANAFTIKVKADHQHVNLWTYEGPTAGQTVGAVTIDALTKMKIPFKGDTAGIVSIFSIENRVDVISRDEVKAWGWCYSVDGVVSDALIDEKVLSPANQNLLWFYGYAHYKHGSWTGYCLTDSASGGPL